MFLPRMQRGDRKRVASVPQTPKRSHAMRTHLTLRILTAALVLAGTSFAAHAEETTCTGTIGTRTLDNIRVPAGRNCTLNGTRAIGTVKVENGASLAAHGVQVNGNIQAEGAYNVLVRRNSFVGGSIQIK